MTFKTHREFSLLVSIPITIFLMRKDMLPMNYYLALIIVVGLGKLGAWFPDLDHHWESVKEKNILNWIFNKILRKTGAKHRSRHTHSIDILLILMVLGYQLPLICLRRGWFAEINAKVLSMILLGFFSGWISHILADMLTSEGVYLFCWARRKVAFVPKKIGKLRFNTGHAWEDWVYEKTVIVSSCLLVVAVLYPIILLLIENPEQQALDGLRFLIRKLKQGWKMIYPLIFG